MLAPILGLEAPCPDERPIPTLTRIKSRGRIVRRTATLNGQRTYHGPGGAGAADWGRYGVDFARDAAMICGIAP